MKNTFSFGYYLEYIQTVSIGIIDGKHINS